MVQFQLSHMITTQHHCLHIFRSISALSVDQNPSVFTRAVYVLASQEES